MVRKILLVTLLVNIVASPLRAMQSMLRLVYVGVRTAPQKGMLGQIVKEQLMHKGVRSVANDTLKITQETPKTVLFAVAQKQKLQAIDGIQKQPRTLLVAPNKKNKLESYNTDIGESQIPTQDVLKSLVESKHQKEQYEDNKSTWFTFIKISLISFYLNYRVKKVSALEESKEMSEQELKQIEMVKSLIKKERVSADDSCLIKVIYDNGTKEFRECIIDELVTIIDFTKIEENKKYGNLKDIITLVVAKLPIDKQIGFVRSTLLKENISRDELHIIKKIYENGVSEFKKGLLEKLDNVIDFAHLGKHYFPYLEELIIDFFMGLNTENKIRNIEKIFKKDKVSQSDLFLMEEIYKKEKNVIKNFIEECFFEGCFASEKKHTPTDKYFLNYFTSCVQNKNLPQDLKNLTHRLNRYSADNINNNKITFFHGQAWYWNLQAIIVKKLYEFKHRVKIDGNFTFLRFVQAEMGLCEKHQKKLVQTGIRGTPTFFSEERSNVIFVNLALFANGPGSNTVGYVLNNNDQSLLMRRKKDLCRFVKIFKDFGFEKEIQELQRIQPTLLKDLTNLHFSASSYGNFVTIVMPKQLASQVAYPGKTAGPRIKYKNMDDIVSIVENFERMPFENEFCIVLGPNIVDPIEAKKTGIEIKSWNTANPKIIVLRDALIDEIIAWCEVAQNQTKSYAELAAWGQQIVDDAKKKLEEAKYLSDR